MEIPTTLTPKQIQIGKLAFVAFWFVAVIFLLVRHLKSSAAYARAMNAIADAASKGENVTVQVAYFTNQPAIHATATADTESK
jgi:hypothetical protein